MDEIFKQFGKDKIEEVVAKSNSFMEVTILLGLPANKRKNVERTIKRLCISVEHFEGVQRLKNSKNRYNKERLQDLVKSCKNYKEILLELDILPISTNYERLKRKLREFDIDFSHLKYQKTSIIKPVWSKENLLTIINSSKTQGEVLEKLGLRSAGGNFNTLKKYLLKYQLDTSHFIKSHEKMTILTSQNKISLIEILVENSNYGRTHLKERLYKESLKERRCELCNQDENWQGKKMSLILDHINGIFNDNRIENLRIVCPNCNATLETHCGKNKK